MDIRTILVPVADEAAARHALEAALPLARRFGAHLTALHVRYDSTLSIPYVAGPVPADMLLELSSGAEKLADERAARLKLMVDGLFSSAGLMAGSTEWLEATGNIDFRYGTAGRVYDLAVVAHPEQTESLAMGDVLEGLLFHSGRPVLMVPAAPVADIGRTIVIAWNGSREGARAVSAAMPFLVHAERIIIVTVGDDGEGPDGQALADSLKWHGLAAEVLAIRDETISDGAAILKQCALLDANLLVTGAYSHSRLRALILGGVTQDIISRAPLPVLFTH